LLLAPPPLQTHVAARLCVQAAAQSHAVSVEYAMARASAIALRPILVPSRYDNTGMAAPWSAIVAMHRHGKMVSNAGSVSKPALRAWAGAQVSSGGFA
jgi:hypothetical protein